MEKGKLIKDKITLDYVLSESLRKANINRRYVMGLLRESKDGSDKHKRLKQVLANYNFIFDSLTDIETMGAGLHQVLEKLEG